MLCDLLQQNYATEQADRHREEEVQHGPEKGQRLILLNRTLRKRLSGVDPTCRGETDDRKQSGLCLSGDPVSLGE